MAVAAADLVKAVNTLWDASRLNEEFNQHWDAEDVAGYPTLNDGEATPGGPWPYCVYEQGASDTTVRMSSLSSNLKLEIHDVPWTFRVHAKIVDGDASTAKQVTADLVEEILAVFGGHPTEGPQPLVLDHGNFLLSQHQTDYCIRTGDDEFMWIITYIFRVDIPVRI